MEKIHTSFTKELRNVLFSSLFFWLDSFLDDTTLKSFTLRETAKRIKFQAKELQKLRIGKRDTQLTKIINEKLQRRTKYLASLRMEINAKHITYLPEKRKAAHRLIFWLDLYKEDLYKPSATTQSNLVNSMIDDRKKIPEIQKCITLLDLDGLLDEIKKLTDEIFIHTKQRSKENTYSKMLVKNLRNAAYSDLNFLINAVEMDYALSTDEETKKELLELHRIINSLLKDMHTKLRLRRTRSKNKRQLKAVVEELIETIYKPAPAQINLPLVNYKELKIIRTDRTSTSNSSQQTGSNNTTPLKYRKEDIRREKDFNIDKRMNDSFSINRDNKKASDGKLPPLGKN